MTPNAWIQCGVCGLFVAVELVYDGVGTTAQAIIEPHDRCNPAMMRFFNEESQHFRPFGR